MRQELLEVANPLSGEPYTASAVVGELRVLGLSASVHCVAPRLIFLGKITTLRMPVFCLVAALARQAATAFCVPARKVVRAHNANQSACTAATELLDRSAIQSFAVRRLTNYGEAAYHFAN